MDTQQLVPKSLETYQSCVKPFNFEFSNGWTTTPIPLKFESSIKCVMNIVKTNLKLNGYSRTPKKTTPNQRNLTLKEIDLIHILTCLTTRVLWF